MIYAALTAVAALWACAPGLNDPYQAPHAAALALVALLAAASRGRGRSSLELPVLAALGLWALTIPSSRDLGCSLIGSHLAPFDGAVVVVTLTILLLCAGTSGATTSQVCRIIAVVSVPVSLLAVAQHLGYRDPMLPGKLPTGMRSVSTIGSPVYLGSVLAVCAAAIWSVRKQAPRLFWMSMPACAAALYCTRTRGAWIAAAAGICVHLPARARAWVAGAAVAAAVVVSRAPSDTARVEIWKSALKLFWADPVSGVGPGAFAVAYRQVISDAYVAVNGPLMVTQHGHNLLLDTAVTSGLFGLAALAVLAAALARLLWRADREDAAACGSVLMAYAAVAAFNPVSHCAVALVALVAGCASRQSGEPVVPRRLWALPALAALAVASSVVAGDRFYFMGLRSANPFDRAYYYQKAAAWNRWDMKIATLRMEAVYKVLPAMDRPTVEAMAYAVTEEARVQVGRHPHDALAYEMLAKGLRLVADLGGPVSDQNVADVLSKARSLAPTFTPLLAKESVALARVGDAAGASAASTRYGKIMALRN